MNITLRDGVGYARDVEMGNCVQEMTSRFPLRESWECEGSGKGEGQGRQKKICETRCSSTVD
jgi:hypothetical protein